MDISWNLLVCIFCFKSSEIENKVSSNCGLNIIKKIKKIQIEKNTTLPLLVGIG